MECYVIPVSEVHALSMCNNGFVKYMNMYMNGIVLNKQDTY